MRQYFKVTFSDGDTISTWMNGTREEIIAYYVGNKFNLGVVEDNIQMAISVEFMED